MGRFRVKKPDSAVVDLCIPYRAHKDSYEDSDDLDLQLDALLLQLNAGEYVEDAADGDTEDDLVPRTEDEAMLEETDGESRVSLSVGSMAILEQGLESESLDGIENTAADGDAPLASIDALTPSPDETREGTDDDNVSGGSVANASVDAELPVTESESPVLPESGTDSQGNAIDCSGASMPSYPDSGHDFFKPPTAKAREIIKRFLKNGEDEKVFQMLNRALKSDLNLENAIYRILDILEKRRVDLSSVDYLEKDTTASVLHTSLLFKKENATSRLIERFPYLLYVNYTSKKYRDQTCFHIAVANKDCTAISKMLCMIGERSERKAILNTVADGNYFIHERPEGSTCLSVAAWMGQLDMIERLIVEGADLELKGTGGNTMLHFIVMLSIKNLSMLTARKLIKGVYENSGWWWADAKDSGTSVDDEILKKQAFQHLMQIPNDAGLTPAGLAVHLHSPLTGFILSFEPVYKLPQDQFGEIGVATYDVTGILSYKPQQDMNGRWHYDIFSLLHVLAHTDKVVATDKTDGTIKDVAEMEPIKTVIEMKWKVYRWLYLFWFFVHALFMIILTSTALHYHDTNTGTGNGPVFGLFLPVPLFYLAFEVLDFVYTLYRHLVTFPTPKMALLTFFKQQFIVTGNIANRIILFIFSWCMLIWCGMYHQGNKNHVVPLSLALILGWVFMLFFSRGCRHVCRFSAMVQRMLFRDLVQFLAIYVFILIGFSAAVHMISPQGVTTSRTFFLMLNVLTNVDINPKGYISDHEGYARLVLGVYGVISIVLLLSLLIAMMSTTYQAVKSSDVNLLRYQQLSTILLLERRFFWWIKLCKMSQRRSVFRFTADITDPERRECRILMSIQEHLKR